MKSKFNHILTIAFAVIFSTNISFSQSDPCDVVEILHAPSAPLAYSADSSFYFINVQDTAGVFQIYVGNTGDPTPTCISAEYTEGNCCGLFRHWKNRNKLQVKWHPTENLIICAVEKEFYTELLITPYELLLGWLQSGIWMDVWAVTPDGGNWYLLDDTEKGVVGPVFTPDATKVAWAEALDTSSILVDVFGVWDLLYADFEINNGVPSLTNIEDKTPAGARWVEPGNFSPDGESLLLSSDIGLINAEGQDQYILNINSGEVINLTNTPMVWDEHGVFSPDGNKILFMTSYPYMADTNSYHVISIKTEFMLMDTDGSNLQQLTHFLEPGYPETHPGIAATGHFTPDGSTIYAQSLVFPDYENWIIKFHGNCGNDNITSTKILSEPKFSIFPNPTLNILNIKNAKGKGMIYNSSGQLILETELNDEEITTVDVSHLGKGIFNFVLIKNSGERTVRRFVK